MIGHTWDDSLTSRGTFSDVPQQLIKRKGSSQILRNRCGHNHFMFRDLTYRWQCVPPVPTTNGALTGKSGIISFLNPGYIYIMRTKYGDNGPPKTPAPHILPTVLLSFWDSGQKAPASVYFLQPLAPPVTLGNQWLVLEPWNHCPLEFRLQFLAPQFASTDQKAGTVLRCQEHYRARQKARCVVPGPR